MIADPTRRGPITRGGGSTRSAPLESGRLRSQETIIGTLLLRGDLWEVAPGITGLRGPTRALFETISHRVRTHGGDVASEPSGGPEEWRLPAAVPLGTLHRAEYFQSFPQWLTAAAHLSDDPAALERVAAARDPGTEVHRALQPCSVALPPALCYQTYASLAGRVLSRPLSMTAQGTCWRHEGTRLRPLSRGWAFTMREQVCVGDRTWVDRFVASGMERAVSLAATLGIPCTVEPASDPFYAPTSVGKARLQRVMGLKRELVVPCGQDGLAIASSNLHDRFFGEAFDIRLPNRSSAFSGCVAYGLERWTLAFLMTHGTDPSAWGEFSDVEGET